MRSRALITVLLTVAVVSAWLNGLLVRWFQVEFQFGDTADRGDYLVGAGGCLATALLLFVAMIALFAFRPPRWLLIGTAIGVGTQLALSITSYRHARGLGDDAVDGTFGKGFREVFLLPGSWPLLLAILVAVVVALRGRSSPAPPPPPDR